VVGVGVGALDEVEGHARLRRRRREELGKFNYVLSVPIQKSTDYEEGLLAYGTRSSSITSSTGSGFVNKALNSLKTFQPGAAATEICRRAPL
jgi:hypothetical protein